MEILGTTYPPSPVTFQKALLDAARQRGLTANEPLGAVVHKMTRDLRVMPMIQFRAWYMQKKELLEKARTNQGLFSYGQIILTNEDRITLEELFRWKEPSLYQPVQLLG